MGGWPRLSILCPSYQQGRYIEETIRSVLLQNYPNFEFIVIDGGSSDDTVAIIRKYERWIAHWESLPDRGQSHALNKACTHMTGDVIGWINSDDYYLPGAFASVARAFRRKPQSLLFGDWCELAPDTGALRLQRELPALAFQVAVGARHLPSHATFWPRQFHQAFDEALRFTMDADLFKRLASAGLKPVHLPQPLGVFRRHADAKTSTIADVAKEESETWSRSRPWHTHYRWRLGRLLNALQRHWHALRHD